MIEIATAARIRATILVSIDKICSREQRPLWVSSTKLPRNFCKAKRNDRGVVLNGLRLLRPPSELAGQFLKRLIVFESGDVVDGSSGYVQQGFSSEKCLVPGDDHIWKSEQPREHVIAKN